MTFACARMMSKSVFVLVKSCDDMKTAANFFIGEIVLSSLGLIFSIAGVFLGFMSICCGPWKVCITRILALLHPYKRGTIRALRKA